MERKVIPPAIFAALTLTAAGAPIMEAVGDHCDADRSAVACMLTGPEPAHTEENAEREQAV